VKKFRTKASKGYFEDDAIESDTVIAEIEGQVLKIGTGALTEAETSTSKKTDIHKWCTLLAIARECSADEVDNVHVAIGIPVKDYEDVLSRNEYREFILPDGEITVRYKEASEAPVITKTFRIVSRDVLPETLGALFVEGYNPIASTGVIDIGHLNVNLTAYVGTEIDKKYSLTDVLGGNNLVTGLAQELSSAFSLCDEKTVAMVLAREGKDRCLKTVNPNPELEARSKEIIDEYLLNHVREIRRKCDAKRWPVDFMNFVAIGGTSYVLRNEIHEVFGKNVLIPDQPEYANAKGFLRIMVGKRLHKNIAV
jgi:plasmid segregation protein ParM